MQTNDITLSRYCEHLDAHLERLSELFKQTEELLRSTELIDLLSEDLARKAATESMGPQNLTNAEKITAILGNIAKGGKDFVFRCSRLSAVLDVYIRLAMRERNKHPR